MLACADVWASNPPHKQELCCSEVINQLGPELCCPALPYTTVVPDNVAVRVGEVIRLQCLAHGTPPLTYTWARLDGRLPPRAVVSGGDLQINLATADDAGSYKCVASNGVGSSQVIAKVTVRCEFTPKTTAN